MKGRHVSSGSSTFGRDLVVMVVGIALVGTAVFGGLRLFTGDESPVSTTTTTSSASTTAPPAESTTTTTAPPTTTTAAAATTVVVRPPSAVRVLVLNSVGTTGIAAEVTRRLQEIGYQTLPPDNYGPQIDQSRVWYREGFSPEAFELAAEFPDALVERNEFEADADIIVVLGASFAG